MVIYIYIYIIYIIDGYLYTIFLGDECQVDYQLFLVWKPVDCQGFTTLGRDQCLKHNDKTKILLLEKFQFGIIGQKQWFMYIYTYNNNDNNNKS